MKGHQKGDSTEIKGNNLADQVAKRAAMKDTEKVLRLKEVEDKNMGIKEMRMYQCSVNGSRRNYKNKVPLKIAGENRECQMEDKY